MRKRRGRPKRVNVERKPSGQIRYDERGQSTEEVLWEPLGPGVEKRTEDRDGKPLKDDEGRVIEARFEREPLLSRLVRDRKIEAYHERAGDMFRHLWERMRHTALAALPPFAKTNRWERGFGHEPELTQEIVDLGEALEDAYDDAYEALQKRGRERGLNVVTAVEAVCFGDVRVPSIDGVRIADLVEGLGALAVHFKLIKEEKKSKAA